MSSFILKLIAIITMLIDHTALTFYYTIPTDTYFIMRSIGRIAMPIFCFLVAEGLFYTKNVRNYALRLLLFAFISIIPFSLMIDGELFTLSYQNVYFTLFFGLLAILCFDVLAHRNQLFLGIMIVASLGLIAQLLHTDYGVYGVFFIFVFYSCRNRKIPRTLFFTLGVFILTFERIINAGGFEPSAMRNLFQLTALIPITLYNGKKGLSLKGFGEKALQYGFYLFYPAHILILYLLSIL